MDDSLLLHVLSFLPHLPLSTLPRCRLVARQWAQLAADDLLWRPICMTAFRLNEKVGPPARGEIAPPVSSFMEAARAWELLRRANGESTLRHSEPIAPVWLLSARFWRKLASWAHEHLPVLLESLGPPAEEAAWVRLVQALELPPSLPGLLQLRALTSVHDGQRLRLDAEIAVELGVLGPEYLESHPPTSSSINQKSHGLLGGYSAYDRFTCCRLFPLRLVEAWTLAFRARCANISLAQLIIGGDWDLQKFVVLNAHDGEVSIAHIQGRANALLHTHRALPAGVGVECAPHGTQLLHWLDEYATRLGRGMYVCEELVPLHASTMGVSLFPQTPPRQTHAVTRGILVAATSCAAPELGSVVYSIRIRLLAPGEEGGLTATARGFVTAQLCSRHWVITDRSGMVEHVRGDGVIGRYPLLRDGGWRDDSGRSRDSMWGGREREGTFVYQSMTSCSGMTLEGELTFVPGSISEPSGPEFLVTVARFPLSGDEYIF